MATLAQDINPQPTPDYNAIKTKQRVAWATGDYSLVGVTLQIVGERLCEALELHAGQTVLDVAGGNGNASLAAARRFTEVTCTDYVPELLERAAQRAQAEGLPITFREADVEALPFENQSFDVVTSTFGAMFAPDQQSTAQEMYRVAKIGGSIGMANWTPDSFIGGLFKTIGRYIPPAQGMASPALWGTHDHLKLLFPDAESITVEKQVFNLTYASPAQWLHLWKEFYGPLNKAFEALDTESAERLGQDLIELIARFNLVDDGTMVVPSTYLEVVIKK